MKSAQHQNESPNGLECEFYPTGHQTEENELQLIDYDGQNENN